MNHVFFSTYLDLLAVLPQTWNFSQKHFNGPCKILGKIMGKYNGLIIQYFFLLLSSPCKFKQFFIVFFGPWKHTLRNMDIQVYTEVC